jgi:hypothetical protein
MKLSNLRKEMDIQVHEAFRTPKRHNQKRISSCHTSSFKCTKQRKNTESCKQKYQVIYKSKPTRITVDLSAEILKARRI